MELSKLKLIKKYLLLNLYIRIYYMKGINRHFSKSVTRLQR